MEVKKDSPHPKAEIEKEEEIVENLDDPFSKLYNEFQQEVKPSMLKERAGIISLLDNLSNDLN